MRNRTWLLCGLTAFAGLAVLEARLPLEPPGDRSTTGSRGAGAGNVSRADESAGRSDLAQPRATGAGRGPTVAGSGSAQPGGRAARPAGPADRSRPGGEAGVPRVSPFRELLPAPRLTEEPREAYWHQRSRSLIDMVQDNARRGPVAVFHVPGEAMEIRGWSIFPAGWACYGFIVPPEGTLKVTLFHPNRAWFRLVGSNKWGRLEAGMEHFALHQLDPVAVFRNPKKVHHPVYLIVDDPGWMSYQQNPFRLVIERSWDPRAIPEDRSLLNQGIWVQGERSQVPVPKNAPQAPMPDKG